MEIVESVDSGKGGCVGAYFIIYVYLVFSYRPSHSPLSKSMHLVPLLIHHPLKVSGFFRGTHNREETLEGDQELYQLLLIGKRSLLFQRVKWIWVRKTGDMTGTEDSMG